MKIALTYFYLKRLVRWKKDRGRKQSPVKVLGESKIEFLFEKSQLRGFRDNYLGKYIISSENVQLCFLYFTCLNSAILFWIHKRFFSQWISSKKPAKTAQSHDQISCVYTPYKNHTYMLLHVFSFRKLNMSPLRAKQHYSRRFYLHKVIKHARIYGEHWDKADYSKNIGRFLSLFWRFFERAFAENVPHNFRTERLISIRSVQGLSEHVWC